MNVYTISPFGGERFHENEKRLKSNELPCAICGKAVAFPFKYSATVVHGGEWARTLDEEANIDDPGYMGKWGVGPDCHKKYLAKE